MNKIKIIIATIVALIGLGILFAQNETSKEDNKYLEIGNELICPVMGERFTITDKTPSFKYKEKIYFFCCPECVEKFKKEPEKYLKPAKNKVGKHNHVHTEGKMCVYCEEEKKDSKNSQVKSFNIEEIAKHNKKGDCWLVIDSKVYDVSDFTYKHNENILLGCGKDATRLFKTRTTDDNKKIGSGMPHSENARKLLDKFYIGNLNK
ncbi:MAG: YHS domain-containing protein [Elusimicrobiota bacterium]